MENTELLAGIRSGTRGSVSASIVKFGHREAVVARTDPDSQSRFIDSTDGTTLAEAARYAFDLRLPFVGIIESTGASMEDGLTALHAWGGAARAIARCAGSVPVIIVVAGPAVSGLALVLGLADFVVMTQDALAYIGGVRSVEKFTGHRLDPHDLGGANTHERKSGVSAFTAVDENDALVIVSDLLRYLSPNSDSIPQRLELLERTDPIDRDCNELREILPSSVSGSYDMRELIRTVVDFGELLEVRAGWAPNIVTGFAHLDGHVVGVLANQPLAIAGTLDIPSSQKGARFVSFCDAFNIALITFVDTPGFYPGKDLEWRGMIRHGAELAFAYAEATNPRLGVVVRKAYGGAYIVMDCKSMGNDFCVAWPTAEIAVMGAQGAVQILHRGASDEERLALVEDYERTLLTPYIAAERGYIDMVIDPAQTRAVLADALDLLLSKREKLKPKKHSNTPL